MQKKLRKKIILLLIVSVFSSNLIFFTIPKKAEAIPVVDAPHIVKTVLVHIWNQRKEVLQKIFAATVKQAARSLIMDITKSTVAWINGTGGNITGSGKPAFVTNPNKFLFGKGGVADRAIGDYIANDPTMSYLCLPFKNQIRLSLALEYSSYISDKIGCTLSQVSQNLNNWVNYGDYGVDITVNGVKRNISAFRADGDWKLWFEKTTEPRNTPVGAYLLAKRDLDEKIAKETQNANLQLSYGSGSLSFQRCQDVYFNEKGSEIGRSAEYTVGAGEIARPRTPENLLPPNGGYFSTDQRCIMKTPGAIITSTLAGVATTDLKSTEYGVMVADGFDAIFSALWQKIANKFTGKLKNGVLGDSSAEDNDYINTLNTLTMTQLVDYNNQLNNLNQDQYDAIDTDWDSYVPSADPITTLELPTWDWSPDGTSTPWIYEIGTTTENIVDYNYPYVYSTTSGTWVSNPDYLGDNAYGASALDQAKRNAITLINSLSASEFAYQNNYKIAQNILTQARAVFATSSICNINYNRNDYILRSLLIRANVTTNIDGTPNSDRTVASIPWNLEVIKTALADSVANLTLLNKASIDVNGAGSITKITDAMIPVNSTSFNTDPQVKMISNIKTWLSGVGSIYNSILCPIDLTRVLQITTATSTTN